MGPIPTGNTSGSLTTHDESAVSFIGHAGNYPITVETHAGRGKTTSLHLQAANRWSQLELFLPIPPHAEHHSRPSKIMTNADAVPTIVSIMMGHGMMEEQDIRRPD